MLDPSKFLKENDGKAATFKCCLNVLKCTYCWWKSKIMRQIGDRLVASDLRCLLYLYSKNMREMNSRAVPLGAFFFFFNKKTLILSSKSSENPFSVSVDKNEMVWYFSSCQVSEWFSVLKTHLVRFTKVKTTQRIFVCTEILDVLYQHQLISKVIGYIAVKGKKQTV